MKPCFFVAYVTLICVLIFGNLLFLNEVLKSKLLPKDKIVICVVIIWTSATIALVGYQ